MNATNRVLAIVGYIASSENASGVTEVSKKFGLSKSSVYRTLSSLKNAKWAVQDAGTRKYSLGPALLELGLSMASRIDLRSASLSFLNELYNMTHEATLLTTRVGLERLYVDQIESEHEVRWRVELGKRFPLWLGAPGKAMLAYIDKKEIETVIDNLRNSGTHLYVSGQVVDVAKLRKELTEIKRQGYAISTSERLVAVASVAAPIFGRDRQVVGAISLGGPMPRFNVELAVHYGPLVNKTAQKISQRLGYSQ